MQSEALEAFLLKVISAEQVLERDAADMAADAPKLEARAVELTQQLQREEKVLPSPTPKCPQLRGREFLTYTT